MVAPSNDGGQLARSALERIEHRLDEALIG
jgi:hypothetical protein